MRRLEGKNALITGSSTGMGQKIAMRFAQEGANIAINYLKQPDEPEIVGKLIEEARQSAEKAGRKFLVVHADISKEKDVARMFNEVVDGLGRLDILINNAGIKKPGKNHETSMIDFDRVIAVNLRGAFLCARQAIKHFLKREGGGVIINNSSVHQIIPRPKYLSYSISKAGIANFTKTLALEYARKGIRVNAIAPGAIDTPINRAPIEDPECWRELEDHIPMGRAGTPEEIAGVLVFLASDDASYITGQVIYTCGGLTLYPDQSDQWTPSNCSHLVSGE
ncbi:MAG: glucose 1-dehydrogenase [Candidatus Glassbacteria bacterium]